MNILLNTLQEELKFIGGDQTYYRNLETAGQSNYDFTAHYLRYTSLTNRKFIRRVEAISHRVNNNWLKSRLLIESRRMPIASLDLENIDIVVSAILAARLPRHSKVANAFLSQGINDPAYYQYLNGPTVETVAKYYRQLAPYVTIMVIATRDGLKRLQQMCPNLQCEVAFARHLVLVDGLSTLENKEKCLKETNRLRLLFVGRDYIRKGLPEVLQAYRAIASTAELHIVTTENCPLRSETEGLLHVHWYSNISNETLYSLYAKSHILVAPTHADTYNLSMVEAMAYGCAILTSDLPPMDELAPPGIVGEVVPRGNVEALREVMIRLVNDQAQLWKYISGALKHFQAEHSPDIVIRDTLAAFKQAIRLAR